GWGRPRRPSSLSIGCAISMGCRRARPATARRPESSGLSEVAPLTSGKADLRYLIDTYLDWSGRQQIPIVEGLAADLDTAETAPWPRLGGGCRCAFVHLAGRGDFLALQLIEIPPGAETGSLRHLYDEVLYVL